MKSTHLSVILLAVPLASCGQFSRPEWSATLVVVDEQQKPVSGANAKVGYYVRPRLGESTATDRKRGMTDTNGIFKAKARSDYMLYFSAWKDGYYLAGLNYELGLAYQYDKVKWSPTQTLVLRKTIKPIPMYAKRVNLGFPVKSTPIGFDFTVGDWVAPHGAGTSVDVLFAAHLDKRAENDFDYKVIVSFPKQGDGIQPFTITELEKTSTLRSPHEAPATGYKAEWVKSESQRPGEPAVYGLDESLNFFFRVRTVLDEKGNVKSAHYGKIYGDFMNFRYYLNPEPNSRNVEFDPQKNLIKKLGPSEHVNDP